MYSLGLGKDNSMPQSKQQSDADKLAQDWNAIGNDLRNAMKSFETGK